MHEKPLNHFTRAFLRSISYLLVAIIILVLVLVDKFSKELFVEHLKSQVTALVHELPDNGSQEQLIESLSEKRFRLFFRVTLLDRKSIVIYESQSPDHNPEDPFYLQNSSKIIEAQSSGSSYEEHWSSITSQDMAYITIKFKYSGQDYLLRSSFPQSPIRELRLQMLGTFLGISISAFLIFCLMIWFIIHRLNQPLAHILTTISSQSSFFASGELKELPNLQIKIQNPDFQPLINTLNSLTMNVNRAFRTMMRERNEKDAILSSMIEGVLTVDDQMMVRYINPSAVAILNVSKSHVTQAPLSEEHLPLVHGLIKESFSNESGTISKEISYLDEFRTKYIKVFIQPSGRAREKLVVLRDETLEHELQEMRKGFVANASHELRTPITIIRGFAETLHDHPEIAQEKLTEITGTIVSNCERMVNLINSLMMLSKVENIPPEEIVKIDLRKTIEELTADIGQVHTAAQIDLDLTKEACFVLGSHELIKIAIRNLIENSIKYSENKAKVKILLAQQEPEKIQITISDQGVGIPEEDLPYIFERFYRVDKARTKKTGGYGLGLSMVKTIIDKHHGKITVSSTLGKGTTFTISLPLADLEN